MAVRAVERRASARMIAARATTSEYVCKVCRNLRAEADGETCREVLGCTLLVYVTGGPAGTIVSRLDSGRNTSIASRRSALADSGGNRFIASRRSASDSTIGSMVAATSSTVASRPRAVGVVRSGCLRAAPRGLRTVSRRDLSIAFTQAVAGTSAGTLHPTARTRYQRVVSFLQIVSIARPSFRGEMHELTV